MVMGAVEVVAIFAAHKVLERFVLIVIVDFPSESFDEFLEMVFHECSPEGEILIRIGESDE